jgi:hypothetical protein
MGAAVVLWVTAAAAQEKPNFNGKWVLDAEKTAAANEGMGGRGGRGGGGPMTLTVDAATLTRELEMQSGVVKIVYKLDGSEQTVAMGQGEAKAKAKWDGNTIVIETTSPNQEGTPVTRTAVYTIEGDYLVIANTGPGRGGGAPVTRKMYYKKS